jgi:hypothetical protein
VRTGPPPGISWTVSFLIPRYDRSFGPDRVFLVDILALTNLTIGGTPRRLRNRKQPPILVDDRNDVATSKLTKWLIEFPPTLRVRRDKVHEAACQAKERDDS